MKKEMVQRSSLAGAMQHFGAAWNSAAAGRLSLLRSQTFTSHCTLLAIHYYTHSRPAQTLERSWLRIMLKDDTDETSDGVRTKLRALMVALFGVSMSVCAVASQPVELELEDDEVAQRLNNVSFARRITKPTIRLVIGYGKLSAIVTAITSLLLLLAVMSKKSWWQRGARWLAAPALLVAALETASDVSDALLVTVLRSTAPPARIVAQTFAACALITVEILVWYFIAKFFQYNPRVQRDIAEKNKEA